MIYSAVRDQTTKQKMHFCTALVFLTLVVNFKCFVFLCALKTCWGPLYSLWFKCTAAGLVIWSWKAGMRTMNRKENGSLGVDVKSNQSNCNFCFVHSGLARKKKCSSWQSELWKQSVSLFPFFSFPSIGFPPLYFFLSIFHSFFAPSLCLCTWAVWLETGGKLCQLNSGGKEKKVTRAAAGAALIRGIYISGTRRRRRSSTGRVCVHRRIRKRVNQVISSTWLLLMIYYSENGRLWLQSWRLAVCFRPFLKCTFLNGVDSTQVC